MYFSIMMLVIRHTKLGVTGGLELGHMVHSPSQVFLILHSRVFLSLPNFIRQPSDNYYENFSDRSLEEVDEEQDAEQDEEQEQDLDWRRNYHNLSRTTYMDDLDLEAGEYNLHFDDVYSRRPETPKI
ncbi:hypothetical protein M0R45_010633 [Rubus argutus]|uniref:Uncharacterized protein n=1 Tax=Rubus argutus TaxID=59490 RepID=A0AAW1Y8E4_RUBAR